MPKQPFALSTVPSERPAQGDYDAICAAVMHSARGRWFLDEFARRNRNADTRVLLDAIERIETVIRGDRSREAFQSFRIDLLEMGKAIAESRAEVAGIKPQAPPQGKLPTQSTEPAAAAPPFGIFAAAERIQDVVWAMRERGLDPALCEQIESLATIILSASSLRDPSDPRAQKLAGVLLLLERRINAMLADVAHQRTQTPLEALSVPQTEDRLPHAGNGHDLDANQAAAAEALAAHEPPPREIAIAPPVSIQAERHELARDPLAALKALSDEERIALFT